MCGAIEKIGKNLEFSKIIPILNTNVNIFI